jgi:hypothetical protein
MLQNARNSGAQWKVSPPNYNLLSQRGGHFEAQIQCVINIKLQEQSSLKGQQHLPFDS